MKRNRLILLALLVAFTALVSYGQKKPPTLKSTFGAEVGLNLSNISHSASGIEFTSGMNTAFHVGAVANFHFGHRNEGAVVGTGMFGLQPELLYSAQGFTVDGERVNFNYIQVPIMAKLYFVQGLNIEFGPYFSYLLSVSPKTYVIDGAQIALSDLAGGMDAGIGVGAGYELKNGLALGARYNLGLSDVANNLAWKNNVIAISIGWLF